MSEHAHPLPPLIPGDRCYIQNQHGNKPKKWDRSGTIVESLGFDSYNVKVDGSGRITKRNRRYLRKFIPVTLDIGPSIPIQPITPRNVTQTAYSADTVNSGNPVTSTAHQPTAPTITAPTTTTPIDIAAPETVVDVSINEHPSVDNHQEAHNLQPQRYPQRERRPPKKYDAETGTWK